MVLEWTQLTHEIICKFQSRVGLTRERSRSPGLVAAASDELYRPFSAAATNPSPFKIQAAIRYFATKKGPSAIERKKFCYPELRVTYETQGLQPRISRAYAKFQAPGVYSTTITQPGFFKAYLEEQLGHLVKDYGAVIEVRG